MAFDSSHEKFNILQKIIFENLVKVNDLNKTKNESSSSSSFFINKSTVFLKEKNHLDENQLAKLNSIISNVPIELIKQSYEKHRHEHEKDKFNLKKKSSKQNSKSNSSLSKFKSNSQLRRKQIENGNLGKPPPHTSNQQAKNDEKLSSSKTSLSINKTSKSQTGSTSSLTNASASHQNQSLNPTNHIVIHVCDEAKRLKQDFTCPRELLVKEMKYFSYNLNINVSNTSQNTSGAHAHASSISALSKKSLDEIDISVHCDINIFDWLMRYVKRNHPNLIEKNIATPENYASDSVNNIIVYNKDGELLSIEPKLDLNNCVSILLSSDFLLMGNLVDKCILFIADNLDSVLNIPCVMSGINDSLLNKIASCVYVTKLDEAYDKKDKLKTKLFQRKIEFLFDVNKLKQPFQNSSVLNDWKKNKYTSTIIRRKASIRKSIQENDSNLLLSSSFTATGRPATGGGNIYENNPDYPNNYQNYLYECENDASSLFKCKLCSRLMTKNQATKLKCQLGILNERGEYVYLHVPDEKFDLTNLLQLLKEKLKTWQSVYWFIWALIKSFKCKKCGIWFRLVELNKCRLNDYTFCAVHDTKKANNASSNNSVAPACYCIHCDHVIDDASLSQLYGKSPILRKPSNYRDENDETPEMRLAKFTSYVLDNFDKHKTIILNGCQQSEINSENTTGVSGSTKNFCDLIENMLHVELQSKIQNIVLFNSKNSKLFSQAVADFESSFVDSITGKHISLVNKNMLSLLKFTQIILINQYSTNQEAPHSVNNNAPSNINNSSSGATNTNISNMPAGATSSSSGMNSGTTGPIGQISNVNIISLLNSSLDLKSCLNLIGKMDAQNIFNCLDVLYFLRVDSKMKWDSLKPVRLNQDNQREDDLKRFREISSSLIKAKLLDENQKINNSQKSALVNALTASYSSNVSTRTNYPGGIYCRVEFEWKLKQS
jgi:hypothetical protein